jgi:hypothetical protein
MLAGHVCSQDSLLGLLLLLGSQQRSWCRCRVCTAQVPTLHASSLLLLLVVVYSRKGALQGRAGTRRLHVRHATRSISEGAAAVAQPAEPAASAAAAGTAAHSSSLQCSQVSSRRASTAVVGCRCCMCSH